MGIINIHLHGEGYELRSKTLLVSKPDGSVSEDIYVEVCPIECATSSNTKDTSRGQDSLDDRPIGK
jgi:hypothetical protein